MREAVREISREDRGYGREVAFGPAVRDGFRVTRASDLPVPLQSQDLAVVGCGMKRIWNG